MHYLKQSCIVLATLLVLAACGPSATSGQTSTSSKQVVYDAQQAQQRSDFTLYRDSTFPFEMQLPSEWYVGDVSNETYGMVATNSNDISEPRALVAVIAEPIGPDFELEQGFRQFTDSFKKQPGLSQFHSVGEHGAIVNGLPGREAYFSYVLDGTQYRHRAVVLQASSTFYGISYAAPDSIFTSNELIFNSVLPTFKGE